MEDFFNRKSMVDVLTHIYKRQKKDEELYTLQISRDVELTYSHTSKSVNKLEDKGFLKREKKARKSIISLTDEGEKVAEKLHELNQVLEEVGEA